MEKNFFPYFIGNLFILIFYFKKHSFSNIFHAYLQLCAQFKIDFSIYNNLQNKNYFLKISFNMIYLQV